MRLTPLIFAVSMLAAPTLAVANPIPGGVIFEARLRYETVSQDGFEAGAQAFTLRTRLGYQTPAWAGFKALVEGENVSAFDDAYNSTTNGNVRYPVIGDPAVTQLNRAQLSWTGSEGDLVVGRQRIILGNARFVGNSGFRQTEQTFDAVKATLHPSDALTVTYAYLDRVHRVFGRQSAQGDWDSDSHVVQAELKTSLGILTGYGYLLDFPDVAAQSSATWGVRFAGSYPLRPGLALTYEAEAARQIEYRNSPTDFSLGYLELCAGLKGKTRWASVAVERLEGDGRRGFTTPLATLFAYQGWADEFLSTPPTGIRDLNLNAGATIALGGRMPPLKLQASAHEFTDAGGSTHYGREVDLLAGVPVSPHLNAELRAAGFDGANSAFADRQKVWMTLEYKY